MDLDRAATLAYAARLMGDAELLEVAHGLLDEALMRALGEPVGHPGSGCGNRWPFCEEDSMRRRKPEQDDSLCGDVERMLGGEFDRDEEDEDLPPAQREDTRQRTAQWWHR